MRLFVGTLLSLLCIALTACTVLIEQPQSVADAQPTLVVEEEPLSDLQADDTSVEPTQVATETPTTGSEPTITSATAQAEDLGPALAKERLAKGIRVYRAQYCGICHVLTVAGTTGTFGPTHDQVGATAAQRIMEANYSGTATTPEAYLLESLTDPAAYIVKGYELTPHRMPSFGHLSEDDLQAIVWLLVHQK